MQPTYTSPAQRVAVRTGLKKARMGRALSERLRVESGDKLRDSVTAARSAGLSTATIAGLAGVTPRRVQQLLSDKDRHAS